MLTQQDLTLIERTVEAGVSKAMVDINKDIAKAIGAVYDDFKADFEVTRRRSEDGIEAAKKEVQQQIEKSIGQHVENCPVGHKVALSKAYVAGMLVVLTALVQLFGWVFQLVVAWLKD